MLTLLTYATKRGLQEYLQQNLAVDQKVIFVTPFPARADALRSSWSHRPLTDVVTLSRFTQDMFTLAGLAGKGALRKSRLLLHLNAFRHLHPDGQKLDYGRFKSAYQVFSDLRAYTDTPELPDEIIANFDDLVAGMAQLFHQACRTTGILDEHAALFELTALLRTVGEIQWDDRSTVIFDGFTFLTPAQLSFFESLSLRQRIIVPVPRIVERHSHVFDWPQALKMLSKQFTDTGEPELEKRRLTATSYVGGSLGDALRQWKQKTQGRAAIILGTKNLTDGHLQEFPFAEVFVKRSVDILSEARDVVFLRWEKRLTRVLETLPAVELVGWIEQDRAQIVAAKDFSLSRELAVLQLAQQVLQEKPELFERQPLDFFLLQLLKEVVAMDSPRNSMVPIMHHEPVVDLLTLKDLQLLPSSGPAVLCIDSSLGGIKSDYRPFSVEMEQQLAKLGPVRRPELEFLFVKAELFELLNRQDLSLLIEEGLLKHDLGWKKIFEETELTTSMAPRAVAATVDSKDLFAAPLGRVPLPDLISASRLQDFLDCPRKYYAERIQKIVPRFQPTLELDPMAIGDVEHKLLALAWSNGENFWSDFDRMRRTAQDLIEARSGSARLSPPLKAAAISEAVLYATNGLVRLRQLTMAFPGLELNFERPLMGPKRSGSIDCLGILGETVFLIDFKRSKGQNPSFTEWSDQYPKIQLWFYLNDLRAEGILRASSKVAIGYLFFKDIEKSWLACSSDVAAVIEQHVPGWAKSWESPWEDVATYETFETTQIQRLVEEERFAPDVRDTAVCDFCSLRPLCPKGTEVEE